MAKKITIELDFESDTVTKEDVYAYLKALMDDDSLSYDEE